MPRKSSQPAEGGESSRRRSSRISGHEGPPLPRADENVENKKKKHEAAAQETSTEVPVTEQPVVRDAAVELTIEPVEPAEDLSVAAVPGPSSRGGRGRGRGRPRGRGRGRGRPSLTAQNAPGKSDDTAPGLPTETIVDAEVPVKRGRGRPKGSTNAAKAKQEPPVGSRRSGRRSEPVNETPDTGASTVKEATEKIDNPGPSGDSTVEEKPAESMVVKAPKEGKSLTNPKAENSVSTDSTRPTKTSPEADAKPDEPPPSSKVEKIETEKSVDEPRASNMEVDEPPKAEKPEDDNDDVDMSDWVILEADEKGSLKHPREDDDAGQPSQKKSRIEVPEGERGTPLRAMPVVSPPDPEHKDNPRIVVTGPSPSEPRSTSTKDDSSTSSDSEPSKDAADTEPSNTTEQDGSEDKTSATQNGQSEAVVNGAKMENHPSSRQFAVVSFTSSGHLEQDVQTVKTSSAEVVCVQRVTSGELSAALSKSLTSLGYTALSHGPLVVCWENKSMDLVQHTDTKLTELIHQDIEANITKDELRDCLKKFVDHSASISCVKLRQKSCDSPLVVCNVNMPRMKLPNVLALQAACCVGEVLKLGGGARCPHVICGTMGMYPGEPAYQLIKEGYLADDMIDTLQNATNLEYGGEKAALVNLMWRSFQHSDVNLRSAFAAASGREPSEERTEYIWFSGNVIDLLDVKDDKDGVMLAKMCLH